MTNWPIAAAVEWLLLAGVPAVGLLMSFRAKSLRILCATFGGAVIGLAVLGLQNPLASMVGYTCALMALNQITPPLLLVVVPKTWWTTMVSKFPEASEWVFDPWVGGTVFVLLAFGVSLPEIFEPALANALFSAPLSLLELLAGLLVWAQLVTGPRRIGEDWKAGLFAIAVGAPMNIVDAVWMMTPHVLYTPYLNVICLWNLTPLQDQQWSGFAMLAAAVPLQLAGTWRLLAKC